MRRLAAIGLVLTAAAGVAVFGSGAGEGSSYKVRVIFDNAAFAIPGEDVKVAGVKVGQIGALDVTADKKAAITLDITRPGFQDFRTDAHCTVRPQSLIGEKFVECTPTAPHPPGSKLPPALPTIRSGPGKGEHLLPVRNTSSPVDIDLINDIVRRPYAERLTIIVNELGTGLAGNGKNLAEAIHRADPALQATDQVLGILARQNRVLANLARDSDAALGPISEQRQHVADFVVKANTVAEATAERRAALQGNLQRLPAFLRQLRPTMVRIGGLSDQMTPVLADLHDQAPAINRFIAQLGPFSQAARPAFRSLGQAAAVGDPAVKKALPIVQQLGAFTRSAAPLAANLNKILQSFHDTGGVERLLDYAFFQVAAINGFDSLGHYLRAALLVNLCSSYATEPVAGCSANFPKTSGSSAASAAGGDPILARTAAVLAGRRPAEVLAAEAAARQRAREARRRGRARPKRAHARPRANETARHTRTHQQSGPRAPVRLPSVALPGGPPPSRPQPAAPAPGGGQPPPNPAQGLFNYLLGND
jgi:ABC-type transporter Mla subunit MlaD